MNDSIMKRLFHILTLVSVIFLLGCSAKTQKRQKTNTALEMKVLDVASRAKMRQEAGPIFLAHRKLGIQEIADFTGITYYTAQYRIRVGQIPAWKWAGIYVSTKKRIEKKVAHLDATDENLKALRERRHRTFVESK